MRHVQATVLKLFKVVNTSIDGVQEALLELVVIQIALLGGNRRREVGGQ
jgi:hypothetical protein